MKAPSPRALSAQALLKVFHAVCKQRLILFAVDILADERAVTFGVAHLAEDTTVRRGDTLDGAHGAVRVPRDIHGRITVQIGVLERYLTVLNQVVNDVLRRYEATLTVRERDGMQVTDVAGGQPRALHRGYASGGVAALDRKSVV